jgi:hypothetical protein
MAALLVMASIMLAFVSELPRPAAASVGSADTGIATEVVASASSIRVTRIVINTPAKTLTAYAGELEVLRCPCAIGRPWTPSPTGIGRVINRQVNPTWYPAGRTPIPPGPGNPLGKRWLGLSWSGYGIHGTNVGASVGTVASHGCIRLSERDILWLYDHTSVGTRVEFIYQPVVVRHDDATGESWVEVHPDIYDRGVPTVRYLQTLARRAGMRLDAATATALISEASAHGVARFALAATNTSRINVVLNGQRLPVTCQLVAGEPWLEPGAFIAAVNVAVGCDLMLEAEPTDQLAGPCGRSRVGRPPWLGEPYVRLAEFLRYWPAGIVVEQTDSALNLFLPR